MFNLANLEINRYTLRVLLNVFAFQSLLSIKNVDIDLIRIISLMFFFVFFQDSNSIPK